MASKNNTPLYLVFSCLLITTVLSFTGCTDVVLKSNQQASSKKHDTTGLPTPVGWVNDYDSLFTPVQRRALNRLISRYEKRTTVQMAVVTVTPAMTSKDDFEAFVLRLHNGWGVGQKEINNGIVIALSKTYRKVRISNGYGIEKVLSNDDTKKIMEQYIIPAAKNGEFYEGIFNAIKALQSWLDKHPVPSPS